MRSQSVPMPLQPFARCLAWQLPSALALTSVLIRCQSVGSWVMPMRYLPSAALARHGLSWVDRDGLPGSRPEGQYAGRAAHVWVVVLLYQMVMSSNSPATHANGY